MRAALSCTLASRCARVRRSSARCTAVAVKFCAVQSGALIRSWRSSTSSVDSSSQPLLDALDHFCHQVDGDCAFARDFYSANTPAEMVALAVQSGILIEADDFRALLRSGSTEFWLVRGGDRNNPIAHLQRVFQV